MDREKLILGKSDENIDKKKLILGKCDENKGYTIYKNTNEEMVKAIKAFTLHLVFVIELQFL